MNIAENEMGAQEALGLLKGWFNNKMMAVLYRIQLVQGYAIEEKLVDAREQIIFLNDLQHHYSRKGINQRVYYDAAKWLKAYFRIYPMGVTSERSKKAWQMLKPIYEGFGLKFPFNDDGSRNESKSSNVEKEKIDRQRFSHKSYKQKIDRPKSNVLARQVIHGGFQSWFNNHMTLVVGSIQWVKPRSEESISKMVYFLHALQSHYTVMFQQEALEDAYDFLWWYFKAYPKVNAEESSMALKMIDRIYEALGLSRLAPVITLKPQQKSCIPQMLKEAVKSPASLVKGCLLQAQKEFQSVQLACESYFQSHSMTGGAA